MQLGFIFTHDPDRAMPADLARPRAGKSGAARPLDRRAGQMALPLEHRPGGDDTTLSVRGQTRIEVVLRELLGPRVIVQLTSNRSTMISYKRRRSVLYVRTHAIFTDAPREVLRAVASFVSEGRPTAHETKLIDDWIALHRHHIKSVEKPQPVQPKGEHHDLQAMFDRLNGLYFKDRIKASITWSKSARNKKRTSMRMGSYCEESQLIRIHPALDQDFVPRFFVESVVFHEMLHEYYGVDEKDGRRCVHPPAFLAHERLFHEYGEARRWELKNLHRLLKY